MAVRRKIMVTGASGFVGSALIARLRDVAPEVEILGLGRPTGGPEDNVSYRQVDVRTDELDAVVAQFHPTHIVHLAARSSVAAALTEARETMDVSCLGAFKLTDAVNRHTPTATVLFSSSGEVYGKAFLDDEPLDEASPLGPVNPYARSKLAAEYILMDRMGPDARTLIMRPLNHTGPGQDDRFVVPAFARQIAEIEAGLRSPVVSVGNLKARRDFLAVDDVVDAYILALTQSDTTAGVEVFNVSSQNLRSIHSVLEDLCRLSTAECSVEVDPARLRPVDVPETRLSSKKLREATGWTPSSDWNGLLNRVLDMARMRVSKS